MPQTFTWIGNAVSLEPADLAANWSPAGPPGAGDTAIVNAGSLLLQDVQLAQNTVYLESASLVFVSDTAGSGGTAALDSATLLTTDVSAVETSPATAQQTLIQAFGAFSNQGTIRAAGPAGSSMMLEIASTILGGTLLPGYSINSGVIEADTGNTLTIDIGATAALFNVGRLVANGGTLLINVDTSAIAGGYQPVVGIAEIQAGGTIETQANYSSSVNGTAPLYVFADSTAGNTLKLDNAAQFGGRIIGFAQGDTIDLGSSLAVGSIAFTGSTGVLALESNAGAILASIVLTSGAYASGSFATTLVAAGTLAADGFVLTTGSDGDTLLTTTVQNTLWNNTSGIWQTDTAWSGGTVPGSSDAPVIAGGNGAAFTIATGSTSVALSSLVLGDPNALLRFTSDGSIGTYGIQQIAGSIEVTTGNTLATSFLRQVFSNSSLLLDPGSLLDVYGHLNVGFANQGTVNIVSGGTSGALFAGTVLIDGGTLNAGPSQPGGGSGGSVSIGYDDDSSPASVTVQNGGVVTDTYSLLGSDPTSFGMLTLTGAGSSWTDAGDPNDPLNSRGYMLVGYNNLYANTPSGVPAAPNAGAAQVLVENGATLTDKRAFIGDTDGSAGTVTVTSGGQWNIGLAAGGYLNISTGGQALLSVTNGGTVRVGNVGTFLSNGTNITGGGIGVGYTAGAAGTIVVDGAGSLLNVNNGIGLGRVSQGILDILNGGVVTLATGMTAGSTLGASGTILVSGPGSKLTNTSTINSVVVGGNGTGTLLVENGGSVKAGTHLFLGNGPTYTGHGLVSLTGSSDLQANQNLYLWNGSTVSLDNSSAIDLGLGNTYVAGAIEVESGHLISGSGLLSANVINNGNVYAYPQPANGTLEITGAVTGTGILNLEPTLTFAVGGINTITPAGVLQLDSTVSAGQTVSFLSAGTAGSPGTLRLLQPGSFAGTLSAFVAIGDRLELAGQTVTDATISGTTLTVETAAGPSYNFALANTPSTTRVSWSGSDVAVAAPAVKVWTGAADTNFANAQNWDDITNNATPAAAAPSTGETAQFLSAGGTVTGTGSVGQLLFAGTGPWTLASGASLSSSSLNDSGTLTLQAGATLVNSGNAVIDAAAGADLTVSGAGARISAGPSLIIGQTGSGLFAVADGGSATVGSTLLLANGTSATATVSVDASSSLEIGTRGSAVSGAVVVDGSFSNGTTFVPSGTLAGDGVLAASIVNNGYVSVYVHTAVNRTLEVTGAVSGSGQFYLNPGSSIVANGTTTVVPGSVLQLDSAVASGQYISFAYGATGTAAPTLRLQDAAEFHGILQGFTSAGDTIELVGQTITAATLNGSTLTVGVSGAATPFNFNLGFISGLPPLIGFAGSDVFVSPTPTYTWTGASDLNFGNALNWNDVTNGLTPAASVPGSLATAQFLPLGGTVNGSGSVRQLLFGSGAWTVTGGATLADSNGLTENAILSIVGGATISSAGSAVIDGVGTAAASMVVSGSGSELVAATRLNIGANGKATLSVANSGSVAVGGSLYIGGGISSSATIAVDATSSLEIGSAGSATAGAITVDGFVPGPGYVSHSLSGDGVLAADLVNNGLVYAQAPSSGLNTLEVTGAVSGNGALVASAGGGPFSTAPRPDTGLCCSSMARWARDRLCSSAPRASPVQLLKCGCYSHRTSKARCMASIPRETRWNSWVRRWSVRESPVPP